VDDAREERRSWLPLVVISLSGLLTTVNQASAMTTMKDVVEGVGTTVSSVEVALVAYGALVAAFGADGARVSSVIGLARTQLLGLGLHAMGMALAGFAPSVSGLVAGQAIAGVGAALLLANGTAILGTAYSGKQRVFAVSSQAGLMGLGASLGLLIGGGLSSLVSWRAPFLFLASVLTVTFLLAMRMDLPKPSGSRRPIDAASVALVAVGVLVLVGAVNQIGPWGLLAARPGTPSLLGLSPVIFLLLGGAVLLRIFLRRQRQLRSAARDPLLAPEVLSAGARACLTTILSLSALLSGVAFLLLSYSEVVLGHSAIESALTLLPGALAMLVGATIATALAQVVSPKALVAIAITLCALGSFILAAAVSNEGSSPSFWIGEGVIGVGLGVGIAVGDDVLLASAPLELYGDVGSARAVSAFLGSALGTAVAGAVLLSSLGTTITRSFAEHPELMLPTTVELSPTAVNFVSNDKLRALLAGPPWSLNPVQLEEAVRINVEARLTAFRTGIAFTGLLMLGGLFGVWAFPSRRGERGEREEEEEVATKTTGLAAPLSG